MSVIDVRRRILAENERAAADIRARFAAAGTLVLNLISSPGSGKTTLLEATVARLGARLRLGAVVGDIATERDAARLRRLGIPAHQILTGGACHLDARQVIGALDTAALPALDVLFVENVGNLICPTSYDLGEDAKVVLLSVAEGEDKPFKYPAIFARAALAAITKIDLLPHVPFRVNEVRAQIATLRAGGDIVMLSALTGEGMDAWCAWIEDRLASRRMASPAG